MQGVRSHTYLSTMKYVSLPDNTDRKLPFYLTMEEYVGSHYLEPGTDLFFMWQVSPTVIFGRNQIMEREVNLDYCAANNIDIFRRRSGGGCVYADRSNIMFSYITSSASSVATTFERYTSMVAEMLRSLGLDATNTGRNDILIGSRKVSGNAFYHRPGHSIVHGTMLFDTDMAHILNAITPSKSKLDAKGVASVQSHITTLSEHITMSIDEFKQYARNYLCGNEEITLTKADTERIGEMSKPYYSKAWIEGHTPKAATFSAHRRIEGVGELDVTINTSRGTMANINIGGDFFLLGDLDSQLLAPLEGTPYDRQAVEQAIAHLNVGEIIHGLTNQQFVNLLF